jgi:hypothetical protein
MIAAVKPVFDVRDGSFWISFEDFTKHFTSINVCRITYWQETRLRGKFLRVQDDLDPIWETVISKYYYEFTVAENDTEIFIGIH